MSAYGESEADIREAVHASMFDFDRDALMVFEQGLLEGHSLDDLGGKKAKNFAEACPGVDAEVLPEKQISRSEVFNYVADQSIDTKTVASAVFAWGGMHAKHRQRLFGTETAWVEVAQLVREGAIDRSDSYENFAKLRASGEMPGLGPAYFTKLIYFLGPRSSASRQIGYIMDQWAGCSINILAGRRVVRMNYSLSSVFTVNDGNDCRDYETFCQCIDALARHFSVSGDQIDRALLSKGGNNPDCWRRYVIEHRRP